MGEGALDAWDQAALQHEAFAASRRMGYVAVPAAVVAVDVTLAKGCRAVGAEVVGAAVGAEVVGAAVGALVVGAQSASWSSGSSRHFDLFNFFSISSFLV